MLLHLSFIEADEKWVETNLTQKTFIPLCSLVLLHNLPKRLFKI